MVILAMAQAGRDDAFEKLFREFFAPIHNFFTRLGCVPEESSDLAQETFLRAYRSFDGFRGDSKRSTWLFTIAKNVWRNHLRSAGTAKRAAAEVPLPDGDQAPAVDGPMPLEDVIQVESRELVRSAISSLPPQMRRCVSLRVYQDMKFREIAEILDVTVSTAKSQLTLAKRRLRSLLAEHPDLGSKLNGQGD